MGATCREIRSHLIDRLARELRNRLKKGFHDIGARRSRQDQEDGYADLCGQLAGGWDCWDVADCAARLDRRALDNRA